MSIQSEIERITTNVTQTYSTLEEMGADMPETQNTDNLPETLLTIKAVRYNEQTLSDDQKTQARTNIGAASAEELSAISQEITDYQETVNGMSLGIASDGLIYIFRNGEPVGTGIPQGTGQSGDIFGYVDENGTIVLTGNLPDGEYSIKYEMENGDILDIGDLVLSQDEPIITYTNLLPLATDASGNLFVGTNGEKGYKAGYRLSLSSGNESAYDGYYCTGFIPITFTDVLRIKNIEMGSVSDYNNMVFYDSSKNRLNGTGFANENITVSDGVYTIIPNTMSNGYTDCAFIRFGCGKISNETIVTVNQEIV